MSRTRRTLIWMMMAVVVLASGIAVAQEWRRGRRGGGGGGRSLPRGGVPQWELKKHMPADRFTFVRIEYDSWGGGWGGEWTTDYPDADLNFSYRLQQLTSMEVDPNGVILRLTDPRLFDYPFIYIIEPGRLVFSEREVENLRRYLLNGGFLMVDDFWGEDEWQNFYEQIKRVFPDREPRELPLEHPIFHAVFDLKEKPQVPSIHSWQRYGGATWERSDARTPHYKGIFDDEGRLCAIICHNTDLGDGWEREGEDPEYFKEFSEPKSYPLGINIVFYALTH